MKTYVIMKEAPSPIAITSPRPHMVCFTLYGARRMCELLNDKATTNVYWYKKVKNMTEVSK